MNVNECSVCDNTGTVCEECGLSVKECKEVGGCDEPRQKVTCPACDGAAGQIVSPDHEEEEPDEIEQNGDLCPVCEKFPCECEEDLDNF
jgi:hypothetical protein